MLAKQLIQSGNYECVLALGFEKMERGLSTHFKDREFPGQKHFDRIEALGAKKGLVAPHLNHFTSEVVKMFAYAARDYSAAYPDQDTLDAFHRVSFKNHRQSVANPKAMVREG